MKQLGLMARLLVAGYPVDEIYHHESDLYVYVCDLTHRVVNEWATDNGFDANWHCPTFRDEVTGKSMYDCAFQYSSEDLKELSSVVVIRKLNRVLDENIVQALDSVSGNDVVSFLYDEAFGIFVSGKLVGYCTLGCADVIDPVLNMCKIISNVDVLPAYRRNQLGEKMVGFVVDQNTYSDIYADVLDECLYSFYERFGFALVDENGLMLRKSKPNSIYFTAKIEVNDDVQSA